MEQRGVAANPLGGGAEKEVAQAPPRPHGQHSKIDAVVVHELDQVSSLAFPVLVEVRHEFFHLICAGQAVPGVVVRMHHLKGGAFFRCLAHRLLYRLFTSGAGRLLRGGECDMKLPAQAGAEEAGGQEKSEELLPGSAR